MVALPTGDLGVEGRPVDVLALVLDVDVVLSRAEGHVLHSGNAIFGLLADDIGLGGTINAYPEVICKAQDK